MPNEPVARINSLTDQPKTTPTQDAIWRAGSKRLAILFKHEDDSFGAHRG
jgi:hypothetical protein